MAAENRQVRILILGALIHGLVSLWNIQKDYWDLSGSGGLLPDATILTTIAEDYTTENILKYFPTLLYMVDAYWILHAGIIASAIGILAALTYRTLVARACSVVTYICLLSFSQSRGMLLWFPWDCLLFEMLLLAAIVPSSRFARRFLLFRVMFGFGKHKFLGAHELSDLYYTSSMACWQPLGSSLGWYLSSLPGWIHIVSVVLTFITEVLCPFIILFGWGGRNWVRASCWMTVLLMFGIQVSGHFGWFNTLTAWLAYVVMQDAELANSMPAAKLGLSRPNLLKKSIKSLYILLGVLFLIPSQWNSPAMFYQQLFSAPQWDVVRVISSWRVLHTYGVFPPKKLPAIKPIGRFEIQFSDGTSHALEYMYQNSGAIESFAGHNPFFVAPFRFPRFDYIIGFYGASNVWNLVTRLGPIVSDGEEYLGSVAHAIFERKPVLKNLFKNADAQKSIQKIVFAVLGIVPDRSTHGWAIVSREVSKEWDPPKASTNLLARPFSYGLPPGSVVLRKKAKTYSKDVTSLDTSPQALFNRAVWMVDQETVGWGIVSEHRWLQMVEQKYYALGGTVPVFGVSEPAIWPLAHSMEFAGYLGCLTFLHLVPPALHSPICPVLLETNRRMRKTDQANGPYSKIPIDPMVYWLLGMGDTDSR